MKRTKELQEAYDRALKALDELSMIAEKKDNKENIIEVPERIKIYTYLDWEQVIIKWKQALWYDTDNKIFYVTDSVWYWGRKHKLVKTTKEEIKPWDVIYASDNNLANINILSHYHLALEDWSFQWWNWKELSNDDGSDWTHYYKVTLNNK